MLNINLEQLESMIEEEGWKLIDREEGYESSEKMGILDEKGHFMISWVDLNEGYNGEYNPRDKSDEKLLRFDIKEVTTVGFDILNNGSYCTCLPVNCSKKYKVAGLYLMAKKIFPMFNKRGNIKRKAEELSQINRALIKDLIKDKISA